MRVVVVGAGAIGMMQARDLALKGVEVILLERNEAGREASWAGGGIVSPLYPWRYSKPVTTLARWSQSFYPNLAESLEAESGVDPQLTKHGLLMLDVNDRDEAIAWGNEQEAWLEPIGEDKIYQLEPNLRENIHQGLWMPHVASIRNPRLLNALKGSLRNFSNVQFIENAEVSDFVLSKTRVNAVRLANGDEYEADAVVICTGSWTAKLLDRSRMDIKPVKGQMLLFKAEPGLVNRVVLSNGKYVIPRRDGSVLAGSTLEDTGFEQHTTEDAKRELADMAIDLFPDLASCPIAHHWAGLRPYSPDGVPYIGLVPDMENLYVNAGHFRNGLVLAPASIALLSSMVCDTAQPFDASPYDPGLR